MSKPKKRPVFLYSVEMRTAPTCGREDCNPSVNTEHWVDVELRPVAAAAPELLAACQKAQRLIKKIEAAWAEGHLDMAVTEAVKFANSALELAILNAGGAETIEDKVNRKTRALSAAMRVMNKRDENGDLLWNNIPGGAK